MIKTIAIFIVITLAIAVPLVAHFGFKLKGGKMKGAIAVNLLSFFSILSVLTICMCTGNTSVFAEGTADAASNVDGMKVLGSALS
ncbi:MAG: hypothetical protein RR957_00465, partial [Oscillospiraceae bacterium]